MTEHDSPVTEGASPRPEAPAADTRTHWTLRLLWKTLWTVPKIGLWLTLTPIVLVALLWASTAIYFSNLPGETFRLIVAGAFALGWLGAFLFIPKRLRTAIIFGVVFALVLGWWWFIPASNDRDWTPDVANEPTFVVEGNQLTVHNVRNFDYRSPEDFDEIWEPRTYDLDQLESLDLVLSDWGLKDVVHTMLSFGFRDGRQLCLSVETRKEVGEPYSIIRGFFKQYELVYVVADERDLLRLRTNFRKEDVYVYPTLAPPEGARAVFMNLVESANRLAEKPRYYNTITHNCTMGLLPLMDPIRQHHEFDIRYWKNGLTAQMAYENGAMRQDISYEELKRRAHVNQYVEDDPVALDYSQRIRAWRDQ